MLLRLNLCLVECSRIIWHGDLNYRIALFYRSAKDLVEVRNWRALLANDQVSIFNDTLVMVMFFNLLQHFLEIVSLYVYSFGVKTYSFL
ncbi:putative Endonuclease/exonuclease/phosphatase superfamily [Helianthus annuus]|nr:putative Endonuclease/exonuclease/phosphatase superfamily [Helianthus annuus]